LLRTKINPYFREAQAYKVQSGELGEAERLEREVLMRRQRAVAHGMWNISIRGFVILIGYPGAHPNHRHLGGNPPGMNQADGF